MREWLEQRVAEAVGVAVVGSARLGGGDVAESFAVDLDDGGRVFAKTHRDPPPAFFETEAAGLEWLRAAAALPVPEVLASGAGYLVLEWIDEGVGRSSADGEAALGVGLAALHRAGAPSFGRTDRRTTGSRRLPNEPCDTWVEFYAHNRLLPLARLAHDQGALPESTCAGLVDLTTRLDDVGGPSELPARLHGDLWAGNRLVDRGGQSWLIDPAAHGGHREFDLAMMRLFGGFGDEAFAAYDEAFPLADGWADRIPLHQLAPLTVHAIKFGGGYVAATERALAAVH
ncbi:MAG: fructosamine kinase family protein [Actinomycetota bacterium]